MGEIMKKMLVGIFISLLIFTSTFWTVPSESSAFPEIVIFPLTSELFAGEEIETLGS